jgi:hypothetical protein
MVNFDDAASRSGQSFFQTSSWRFEFVNVTTPPQPEYAGGIVNLALETSSSWVGINSDAGGGQAATFGSRGGVAFDLASFSIASAWGPQVVTVYGYAEGVLKYTQDISISTTGVVGAGSYGYNFNDWNGITSFSIVADPNFAPTPGSPQTGNTWVVNNISLANINNIPAVPEPETYAMLLAGLGLMSVVARIRRKDRA